MKDLVPLKFEFNGTEILSFSDSQGRDWFRATEVCKILGLSNPSVSVQRHANGYQKEWQVGKGRPAIYVSEPGLYALIFASKSEASLNFQRWIFEEVLPAIRKDGAYIDEHRITDPQLAKVSNRIKQMQQERLAARKSWTDQVKNRLIKDGLYHTTNGTGKVITTAYSKKVFRSLTVEVNEVLFNRRHFYCDRSAFMDVDQQEIITQFEIELAASAREYPDEPIEKIVALALDKILEVQQT